MVITKEHIEKVIHDKYKEIEKEYNDLYRQYQKIKKSDKYSDTYKTNARDYYMGEVMKIKVKIQDELLEELGELKDKVKLQEENKPKLSIEEQLLEELKKNNELIQAQALVKGANYIQLQALLEEYAENTPVLNIIQGEIQKNIKENKDIEENQSLLQSISSNIERNKQNKLILEIERYENAVKSQAINSDNIYLGLTGAKGLGLNIKEQFGYYEEEQDKYFSNNEEQFFK